MTGGGHKAEDRAEAGGEGQSLERSLGIFSATTLIVGSMIGSGIFIAPSIMAGLIATPGVYLAMWLIGGALTLLGALSYGELCAMMPRAGGQYVFLREAFGPMTAFVYGWTVLLVIQSGFNAAVSIAFAKYLGVLLPAVGESTVLFRLGSYALSSAQLVAVGVIVVLTWVNIRGVKEGAFIQNVFTVLKLGAIALLIVVGFSSSKGSTDHFRPLWGTELGPAGLATGGFLAAAGAAMSKELFAYDAWNTVTFAAEEVRQPQKNLPRALVWGTILTTLAYTGAAAVYLYVMPTHEMALVKENRVAAAVAEILVGGKGLVLIAVAIMISTFGCVNGLILGGGRVLYAMARDGLFFRRAADVHPKHRTPAPALVLQGIWSAVLALTGSYDKLLTYVTFASLAFNALTVVGLLVLRRTQPELPRPYRVWGYPVVPALYVLIAGFFTIYIFKGEPVASLKGAGIVLLGIPVYAFFRRGRAVAPA
jgi:APA family basic amino acid/polyamine antiporter